MWLRWRRIQDWKVFQQYVFALLLQSREEELEIRKCVGEKLKNDSLLFCFEGGR